MSSNRVIVTAQRRCPRAPTGAAAAASVTCAAAAAMVPGDSTIAGAAKAACTSVLRGGGECDAFADTP